MLDFIQNGPTQFCDLIDNSRYNCTKELLTINVWQFIMIVLIFLTVFLIAKFFSNHKRLDRYYQLEQLEAPFGTTDDIQALRLNPHAMARALGEKGYERLTKQPAAIKLNEKYAGKYFVVEIREGGRTILRKELKLTAWWFGLEEEYFKADAKTLSQIKEGSASKLDDDTSDSTGADGQFDIFFRQVNAWDIRHWLNHPSREIRYALYVAIFAVSLEYSADIIKLIKSIFNTPA